MANADVLEKNGKDIELDDILKEKEFVKKGYMRENSETVHDEEGSEKSAEQDYTVVILSVIMSTIMIISLTFLFNLGNIREKTTSLIGNIMNTLSVNKSLKQQLDEQHKTVEEQKKLLEEAQSRVQELDKAVKDKEEQINKLEQEIKQGQAQSATSGPSTPLPSGAQQASPSDQALANTAKIYENMDPQDAAAILNAMDSMQMKVAILKKMKKENAAEILAQIPPKDSAALLKELAK